MTKNLNFIDLFSGAGGLSCGMELSGWRCLLGVDMDKFAMQSFKANHHHAEVFCGPIQDLTEKKLKELTQGQKIHAVVGGPPCQGFSTAGLGDPNDMRNRLFLEFVRMVRLTKPYFIVIENVTGLLAKKNEKTLKSIFSQFEKLGYHLDVQVLSSDDYGVPERRRRTIIIGTNLNIEINFPEKAKKSCNVGEALSDLKTKKGQLLNHDINLAQIKSKIDQERIKHIPEGCGIRYEKDEKEYLPKKLWLNVDWKNIRENRFRQTKFLRLDRKKVSPTIMTHRHSYYHPTENRYLTQREAARLQSFPNDFVFHGPLSAQWRQIGNAVPPMLGKAIGKTLLQMLLKQNKAKNSNSHKKKNQITNVRQKAFSYREQNT